MNFVRVLPDLAAVGAIFGVLPDEMVVMVLKHLDVESLMKAVSEVPHFREVALGDRQLREKLQDEEEKKKKKKGKKKVEQLQDQLSSAEKALIDEKSRSNEILKSFNEYKVNFNTENFDSIKRDLALANHNNEELHEEIRRLHKMNTLLSQRVGHGYLNSK